MPAATPVEADLWQKAHSMPDGLHVRLVVECDGLARWHCRATREQERRADAHEEHPADQGHGWHDRQRQSPHVSRRCAGT